MGTKLEPRVAVWLLFTCPAFVVTTVARCQSAGPESTQVNSLGVRMTLENVLDLDPTDNLLVEHLSDRDLVEEIEVVHAGENSRQPSHSSLIVGFGRSVEERNEERGWRGSSDRAILRADLDCAPSIGVGFTGEKDAGERWDLGFRSAYLALRGLPLGGECVAGDYKVRAGLGLVFGNPIPVMNIEETARRIEGGAPELLPHRSRDEVRYLRGVGIRIAPFGKGSLHCLVIASRRNFASSGGGNGLALSPNTLFRTEAEIARKDQIRETMLGARMGIGTENDASCALSILQTIFFPPLRGSNAGQPAGSRSVLIGVDFLGICGPLHVRGELAHSQGGGLAAVLLGSLRAGPALVVLEFQSLSRLFANQRFEGLVTGAVCNETSVKVSTHYVISSLTDLRGSLCHRWTPSLASGRESRSAGWTGSLSATLGLGRRWLLRCSYRIRQGDEELSVPLPDGGNVLRCFSIGSEAVRFSLHYHVGRRIECLTSLETARCVPGTGGESEKGEQVRQEVSWRPTRWLGIALTGAIFTADSYGARTMSMEDDPISRVRYQSLDGDGFRCGASVTLALPRTGCTLLILAARSIQSERPRSRPVGGESEWGIRMRWTNGPPRI